MSLEQTNGAATHDSTNHIDALPAEVLCTIFDLLDLDTIKNASRTCKRWNMIIFASQYAARFVFNLDVTPRVLAAYPRCEGHLSSSSKLYREYQRQRDAKVHEMYKDVIDILTQSERCYRKISHRINRHNVEDMPALWTTIHSKFTTNLLSLDLSFVGSSTAIALPAIAVAIPCLPQLGTLKLRHVDRKPLVQDGLIMLRSSTVENLKVESILNIGIEMPQLRSFVGESVVLFQSTSSEESQIAPLAFGNLTSVHFTKVKRGFWSNPPPMPNASVPLQVSIIRQFKNVEVMQWEDEEVGDEVFRAIYETCTKMKHLWIETLQIANIRVLDHVSKLVNLRDLILDSRGSKDNSALAINFAPLHNLEYLVLPNARIDSLVLPKTVDLLGLTVSSKNREDIIQILQNYRMQLTALLLVFINYDAIEPEEMLKILPIMHNLEKVTFRTGCFRDLSFKCLPAPMDRVRAIYFHNCCLHHGTTLDHKVKFPNLKVLRAWNDEEDFFSNDKENYETDDEDDEDESNSNDDDEFES